MVRYRTVYDSRSIEGADVSDVWERCGDILRCVGCDQVLVKSWLGRRCEACGLRLSMRGEALVLLDDSEAIKPLMSSSDAQSMAQAYRHPVRWQKALRRWVTSEYFPGRQWRQRKDAVLNSGRLLVIGSGTTCYANAIHLDLDNFPGVDIVADAQKLPFINDSFDGVVCEVVLEHVAQPLAVIDEINRVLKPGGCAFLLVPFLFPFHGHPADYRRWSKQGLQEEFNSFSETEVGLHAGPTSALINILTEWLYVASGLTFPRGYTLIKGAATALSFPAKFLDYWINRMPEAHRLAATFYVYAKK